MKFILPLFVVLNGTPVDDNFIRPINISSDDTSVYVKPVDMPTDPDSEITYEEIKEQAIWHCKNRSPEKVVEPIIDLLIEVEKAYQVPSEVRGMLLAAACLESGYNPLAKGDRKFSKNKKKAMAIGIVQQWRWYEKYYGTDRTDPYSAADTWMRHIVSKLAKVKKQCKFKSEKKLWIAAWVTGVRSPKDGGRCYQKPNHYKLLRKWHKNIRLNREDGDGC